MNNSNIKIAGMASTFTATIVGLSLIQQDSSPHFFTLYYTQAIPISLTVGALAFVLTSVLKSKKFATKIKKEERQ